MMDPAQEKDVATRDDRRTDSTRGAIVYRRETGLDVETFRRVLADSSLGAIRPLDDAERLAAMLAAANFVLVARLADDGRVVGLARCLTDFAWCCYVAELAVSQDAQGLGVGRGLMAEAQRLLGPTVSIVLASVPDAVGFYRRIGMSPMPDAFQSRRER